MIRVHETCYSFVTKTTDTICFNLDDMEQFERYAQPNVDEVWDALGTVRHAGGSTHQTVKVGDKAGNYQRVMSASPDVEHVHCTVCERFFEGMTAGNGTERAELALRETESGA
jgi:hypothetical protein